MNYKKVFLILEKTHQQTMLEMLGNYSHFQHVVMTLLSARSKDSTVIPIVKDFFAKYPEPKDVVKLSVKQLEKWFYKIGFYKTKARHVKQLCEILINDYNSQVPDTFDELITLPGVGRKTANCVLSYSFGKPAIAVDIHVFRISNRLGWVKTSTPEDTEDALKDLIKKEDWCSVNNLLVDHGQRVCLPINPKCSVCSVIEYCEFKEKNL